MKAFWGQRDQQLPDGTLILTSPADQSYVTNPGSALLFPSLCHAVGAMPSPEADPPYFCAERTATMPKRRRTRTKDRAYRIATERHQNHEARQATSVGASCTTRDPDHDPPTLPRRRAPS